MISFRPSEITDFQKRKLKGDKYAHPRTRLENNQLPLAELMALGNDSRINVALLAFDRLSGTRNISNSHCFRPEDIRHYQTVP